MILTFDKYQGTGNDFILIDNRNKKIKLTTKNIAALCNRNFGIGADGLMLLENIKDYDFKMVYYNSDGNLSSMCGNGGRCIVKYAFDLGIKKDTYTFLAPDGKHIAKIKSKEVCLQMIDTGLPQKTNNDYFINTGSPHYVKFIKDVNKYAVFIEGKKIRNSKQFIKEGTNVNFIETAPNNTLLVRTYERGVENETLSCGTGVTAVALTYASILNIKKQQIKVKTLGGVLKVNFKKNNNGFTDVWLTGSAQHVFKGMINI